MSMPEQKAVPAPVSTTQWTSSSPARSAIAAASALRSSIESALRFSGRLSVTVATAPSRSIRSAGVRLPLAQERLEARAQRRQLPGLLDGGQQVVRLVAVEQELVAADPQHARERHERLRAVLVELAPE